VVAAVVAQPELAGGFLVLVAAGVPVYALLVRNRAQARERVVILGAAEAGRRPRRH